MGNDQLFKTILERLLQDFLELFFPEVAARLDFGSLSFVGKEVFANVPEGEVREADIVARLATKDGEPKLVLVHVEVEAEHRGDFARRMFQYYAVLRIHHRLRVLPIVLYLRGGPPSKFEEYREDIFGLELLTFRYHSVALATLEAEEYVGTSPLGASLSALMSWKKSRDRAALMASMLERVTGGGLNEALKFLLVNVVKTFFVLTGKDAERYRQLISRKEFRAVQEVELTWADKLMEKGREEGLEKGREAGVIEGKRKTLLRQMSAKFGEVPEAMMVRVEVMSEADLDSVLERILTATTWDELKLGG